MQMEMQIKDIRNSMAAQKTNVKIATDQINAVKQEIDALKSRLHKKEFETYHKGIYTPPAEDEEGWSRWQLWALMDVFGPHMSLGVESPFGPVIDALTEAPDIRAERKALAQARDALDSKVKRGQLIAVEAGQLVAEIDEAQAAEIGQRIAVRSPSPVSPAFWEELLSAMPRDARRVATLMRREWSQGDVALRAGKPWTALLGAELALLLLFPVRQRLRGIGQRYLVSDAPGRLLPTIRSRCARIRLGTVGPRAIEQLLGAAGLADAPTAARLARLGGGRPGVAMAPRFRSGSSIGNITSIRRSRLRDIQSALARYSSSAPPFRMKRALWTPASAT